MKKDKEELKPYRVIFNGNWNNYEEFDNLEKAENFASRYVGAKVKPNIKKDVPIRNKTVGSQDLVANATTAEINTEIAETVKEQLYTLTQMEMLKTTDPINVLSDLGLLIKEKNNQYQIKTRDENTASAFISLMKGEWKYKDFGSGNSGNIINAVMDATGQDFTTATKYCLDKMGIKSATLDDIKINRIQNKQREASQFVSSVTGVYDINTNQAAVDYLKVRGIEKIPPSFKVIAGEYKNKLGEIKKVFGVGVQTVSNGADIHFLHKIGDLKTFSLGKKDITFIENKDSNKFTIFESKMDYAAAYQQMPLDKVNIVISNSVTNAKEVGELLKEKDIGSLMIFNQNDQSGYNFAHEVVKLSKQDNFKMINYEKSEVKQDINDLHLKGVQLASRIVDSNIKTLAKTIDKGKDAKSL